MDFLHISDLHYRNHYPSAETGYLSIFKRMTPPLEILRRGLELVDLQRLSFVLICGDLTEYGEQADYEALKEGLHNLFGPLPCIVTPGNHDRKDAFYKVWYGTCAEECGRTFHLGDTAVIALDNASETCGDGRISESHCAWLGQQLAEAGRREERIILMMHHPLIFDKKTPIPVVEYCPQFMALLQEYPPAAILCGHTHNHLVGSCAGILHATCGSLSFKGHTLRETGEVLFKEQASMNLCHMDERCVVIEELAVGGPARELGLVKMG